MWVFSLQMKSRLKFYTRTTSKCRRREVVRKRPRIADLTLSWSWSTRTARPRTRSHSPCTRNSTSRDTTWSSICCENTWMCKPWKWIWVTSANTTINFNRARRQTTQQLQLLSTKEALLLYKVRSFKTLPTLQASMGLNLWSLKSGPMPFSDFSKSWWSKEKRAWN